MARATRHHSVYPRERKSGTQNQLVWNRKVHLRSGNEQLSVSRRKATKLPWGEPPQPKPYLSGDVEALSRLPAKSAMHQGPLSADRDPCPRSGATTGTRANDRSGFRGRATPTPESRSTFAELKNQIGLRRVRLRRMKHVREQFFLAATAQNLKRLARFLRSRSLESATVPI